MTWKLWITWFFVTEISFSFSPELGVLSSIGTNTVPHIIIISYTVTVTVTVTVKVKMTVTFTVTDRVTITVMATESVEDL